MIMDVAQVPRGRGERSIYLSGAVTEEYILITELAAGRKQCGGGCSKNERRMYSDKKSEDEREIP